MNKFERQQKERTKWKKRLKLRNIPWRDRKNFTCYKSSSVPCSCGMCSHKKYNRAKQKNLNLE